MDVLRCPRCWKPSPAAAAFCRRCGRALAGSATATVAPHWGAVDAAAPAPYTRPHSTTFIPPLPPRAAPPPRAAKGRDRSSPFASVTAAAALVVVLLLYGAAHVQRIDCPARGAACASAWNDCAPAADAPDRTNPTDAVPVDHDLAQPAGATQAETLERWDPVPPPQDVLAPAPPPRIDWISTGRVDRRVPLVIRGRGLGGATRVLFVGLSDGRRADASFTTRSDDLLYATVPDLGPRPQDLAVVVVTARGGAVAAGRTGPDFTGSGFAGPGRLALVENNQTAFAAAGKTLIVRRGGVVLGRGNDDTCLVFRETDVPITTRGGFRSETDLPSLDVHLLDTPLRYAGD